MFYCQFTHIQNNWETPTELIIIQSCFYDYRVTIYGQLLLFLVDVAAILNLCHVAIVGHNWK